jgi:hypothetical protein
MSHASLIVEQQQQRNELCPNQASGRKHTRIYTPLTPFPSPAPLLSFLFQARASKTNNNDMNHNNSKLRNVFRHVGSKPFTNIWLLADTHLAGRAPTCTHRCQCITAVPRMDYHRTRAEPWMTPPSALNTRMRPRFEISRASGIPP